MAFEDLRQYLQALEDIGELRVVEGADWDLEIGAIAELMREQKGPSLLFDKIKGYPQGYRVAANLFGNPRQYCLPYGVAPNLSEMEVIQWWRGKLRGFQPVPPKKVKDGPVMENAVTGKAVNMFKFPTPKWHEIDGGRYIGTGSVTITRDPDTGYVNLGTYRVVIHDEKTVGFYVSPGHHARIMREKYWARGQSCPVAVSFGQDPLLWAASTHSPRWAVSEYDFAGYLRGEPVPVIEGPLTGLPIPANAEIVIEGEAPPPQEDARVEGPFGEWTGYYGHGARVEPVIRVKAIYHRHNPIIQGNPPFKPPLPHFPLPEHILVAAGLWNALEDAGIMDIRGVYVPSASIKLRVISLKQRYHGHAQEAAVTAAAHSYTTTFIIVVDDDIDPFNMEEVLWALATRCDPRTSLDILHHGRASALDPRLPPEQKAREDFTSPTLIMYATRPFYWYKDYPPVNRFSEEYKAKIREKWADLLSHTKKSREK